jgi:hypothetical protein
MGRQRGMVLLDSLMALLALGICLAPTTVLMLQTGRAHAENAYASWMLWQTGNLAEALLYADANQYGALVKQAKRPKLAADCGGLNFPPLTRVGERLPDDAIRLQAVGCHGRGVRFALWVPRS